MLPVLLPLAGAYLVLSASVRAWKRRRNFQAQNFKPLDTSVATAFVHGMGGLAAAVAILLLASLLFEGREVPAMRLLGWGAFASSIIDALSRLRWPDSVPATVRREWLRAAPVAVAGFVSLVFVFYLRSTPGETPVKLAAPLAGEWVVASGGRSRLTNHHHGQPPAQDYAVDLVHPDGPEATEGQTVYAPADAVVQLAVGNVLPGEGPAEGNFVILRTKSGIEIWLAHLQEGSVRVATGDTVKAGQPVASVGATGSATSPHLHIHAQRSNDPVPMHFGFPGNFPVKGQSFQFRPSK